MSAPDSPKFEFSGFKLAKGFKSEFDTAPFNLYDYSIVTSSTSVPTFTTAPVEWFSGYDPKPNPKAVIPKPQPEVPSAPGVRRIVLKEEE